MKRLLLSGLCLCALSVTASAHILDEYLQAAQIALAPDDVRVELRLTPGVELADRVFALIDLDHDRRISPAEEQAYAERVLKDVSLELDHRPVTLSLTTLDFPSRNQLQTGNAAIVLTLSSPVSLTATGDHQLSFHNNHLPKLSVYQANALIPTTNTINITTQQRDPKQHEFHLQFQVIAPGTAISPPTQSRWPFSVVLLIFELFVPLCG